MTIDGITASRTVSCSPALLEKIARLRQPVVVGVSGYGGAGKSTFAAKLGQMMGAPVIGLDSFIISRTPSEYAHWEIIDFARLKREVLEPFTAGQRVRYGHFDWIQNQINGLRELPPTGGLIVEGVGLFRPALLKYFALLIWLACPIEEAIRRGKRRDREEYNNPQEESWDGIWKRNDEQCYRDYQPEKIADFVIDCSRLAASP